MSAKSFLFRSFLVSSRINNQLNTHYIQNRLYRIKTPSFLTKEDRWMLHVYKIIQPHASTITDDLMKIMKEKVEILDNSGCHRYQIVEVPHILLLSDKEIIERCLYIDQHAGVKNISAPIVCLLNDINDINPELLLDKIDQYKQKRSGGFKSIADYWFDKFNCKETELLELVGKNPRLFSTSTKNMEIKMNILLKYGARLDDIRAHSHILKNRRSSTLEHRAKELYYSHPGIPLSVSWLAQSDTIYREILHNHLRSEEDKGERLEYFTNTFGGEKSLKISPSTIPSTSLTTTTLTPPVSPVCRDATFWLKIPYVSEQQFHILKPKLEFLLSKGYTHDDIATAPYIFKLGLASLRSIHDELHQRLAIEHVTLRMICSFSQRRAISKYRLPQHVLAKVIGCSPEDISPLSKELRVMFLQSVSVMTLNFRFLVDECGFLPANIQKLPVILGHAHQQVRSHWQRLPDQLELQPFCDWQRADSGRLLNTLQYFIERQHNYQHPIVFECNLQQNPDIDLTNSAIEQSDDQPKFYIDNDFDFEDPNENRKPSTSMDYRYREITNTINGSKKNAEINV